MADVVGFVVPIVRRPPLISTGRCCAGCSGGPLECCPSNVSYSALVLLASMQSISKTLARKSFESEDSLMSHGNGVMVEGDVGSRLLGVVGEIAGARARQKVDRK